MGNMSDSENVTRSGLRPPAAGLGATIYRKIEIQCSHNRVVLFSTERSQCSVFQYYYVQEIFARLKCKADTTDQTFNHINMKSLNLLAFRGRRLCCTRNRVVGNLLRSIKRRRRHIHPSQMATVWRKVIISRPAMQMVDSTLHTSKRYACTGVGCA